MTKEQLQKENEAIFETLHRSWLGEPLTKALNLTLDRHIANITNRICAASMDSDVSSEFVRLLGAQLSTAQTIKNLINDTKTFAAKCSPAGE